MSVSSYPSIFALGHRAASDLLSAQVIIEEKIDGSQFSFGVTQEGQVIARSKGVQLVPEAPEGMFARAIETVMSLKDDLRPGYVYRAEYLAKPKHNTLKYGRVPEW